MFGLPRLCSCSGGVQVAVAPRRPAAAAIRSLPVSGTFANRRHTTRTHCGKDLEATADESLLKEVNVRLTEEEEKELRKAQGEGLNVIGLSKEKMAEPVVITEAPKSPIIPEDEDDEEESLAAKITPQDVPFKVGDNVKGTIRWTNDRGCKVAIENTPFQGWCMAKDFPFRLTQSNEDNVNFRPKSGLVREFKILAIPDDCEPGGKGPLVTAKDIDKEVLYQRLRQVCHVCTKDFEVVQATFFEANDGGLRAATCGAHAFLPRSQCIKESNKFYTNEELEEIYCGKWIPVSILTCDSAKNRVVLSEIRGKENQILRKIQPGSLVWGKVQSIREWGAFVAIDGTNINCLLHISNISQANVPTVEDVFAVGDVVCAVIISMEENFRRISVSTADLEETTGDMLMDKEKVYKHAPIAVAQIQKEIDAQRAEHAEE